MIISHRGNDLHNFKENTKEAIISTLSNDYTSGVELDVRMTKDKKIVLSHSLFYKEHIISLTKYKDLSLDLLKNVLKGIKSKKIIIIEIKDYNFNIIPVLYKVIKSFSNLNIYIHSFYYDILKIWKERYPKYKVGLIKFSIINMDKANDFDFISLYYKSTYKGKKEVFYWTVNEKKDFIRQNINIITDKPYIFSFTTNINCDKIKI